MSDPTVVCVMLTADRPHLARRAVESFRSQTYPAKRLLILDSGKEMEPDLDNEDRSEFWVPAPTGLTIGELRNKTAAFWTEYPIYVHWDSDDWSHPNRIAEQVALLQSSGADCVGMNEVVFWKTNEREAWLYTNRNPGYCVGSSLMYWRKTWERKPFAATSQGEDLQFCTGLKCVGVSSLASGESRLIARIHDGNTSTAYRPESMLRASEWRRLPELDEAARRKMEGYAKVSRR